MKTSVSLTSNPDGTATLLVGGKNLSNGVSGIRLAMRAGDVPRVVLDVPVDGDLHYEGSADVVIDSAASEALIALGWVPPAAAAV